MIDLGLVVSRLLHYAAVTTLAGVSFFPLYAYADAEPVVLLSPACASFDQFRDFEHRGDTFREMLKMMTESQTPAVRSAGTA